MYLDGGPQGGYQRVAPAGSNASGFRARIQDALHESFAATDISGKPGPVKHYDRISVKPPPRLE